MYEAEVVVVVAVCVIGDARKTSVEKSVAMVLASFSVRGCDASVDTYLLHKMLGEIIC